ncbi:zinc finger protein ZAT5-like [Juglans microcarpa x Juglans regia]|uniref:zinc finger protein ZAT5-like n=1 Tax=Juglans microcarpa x Juglans regia TaxID=2249226 RepID=UPI001B7EF247|nr:zinc finger protein ZAT5-like [Juglans microcarpa x Juglans regia]
MGRQAVLAGYDDHTQIAKGKSTKRQRLMSPYGVILTSSSSSTGCAIPGTASSDIDGGSGGGFGSYGSVSSGTTSEDVYDSTDDHQEDEDMANCLILLAQGDAPRRPLQWNDPMERFGVRKFSETATGKGGFYVHQCKTCNRTFPSFQALGGHRASHKKPKAMVGQEIRKAPITPFTEYPEEARFKRNSSSPSKPLQTANIKGMHGNKAKIHECSICGLEFMSGQALGGHMRRHRPASTSSQVAMSIDAISTTMEDSQHVEVKPRNILSLDLNLPAPEEDQTMLKLTTAQQSLVLISSPVLVDCHY